MSKLFDSLSGGSVEQQVKKKFTIKMIGVTVVLVFLVVAVLVISLVVTAVRENKEAALPVDGEADGTGSVSPGANTNTVTMNESDSKSGALIIINGNNVYDFTVNSEASLVKIIDSRPKSGDTSLYMLKDNTLRANPTALAAFNEMITAFYAQCAEADKTEAKNLTIWTAYRSEEDQSGLSVAVGRSDFHSGMLFELRRYESADGKFYDDVKSKTVYKWIFDNAHKYGFILRYPDGTSAVTGVSDDNRPGSALRYVGIPHATYIYQYNQKNPDDQMCLESYVEMLKSKTQSTPLKVTSEGTDKSSYEVYYSSSTTVPVPKNYVYEISGDNMGGFIVTVNKSVKKSS